MEFLLPVSANLGRERRNVNAPAPLHLLSQCLSSYPSNRISNLPPFPAATIITIIMSHKYLSFRTQSAK